MRARTLSTRAIAAVTTLALCGAASLALASPASAGEVVGADIQSSATDPAVIAGQNNQAAGDWTTTVLPAVAVNDTITIAIDDSDVGANCSVAGDTVAFAALPTVTNVTAGNAAVFSRALGQSAGLCDTANVNDVLTLTATTAGAAGAQLKISGIAYNLGNQISDGSIRHKVGAGAFTAANPNAAAFIVSVTHAAPPLVAPSSTNNPVPNISFNESRAGAIAVGSPAACAHIAGPAGTHFSAGLTPAVSTPTGATATGPAAAGADASFNVTVASTTAGSYVLSGLKIDAGATPGPVFINVGPTCGSQAFAGTQQIAFVGTTDRLAGSDRYATAQQIAEKTYGCVAGRPVVIARGDNFPDALAASYLAGINNVPILLTAPTSMPNETLAALQHLGATSVILIGGEQAISPGIATLLDNQPVYACGGGTTGATLNVDRAGGVDRYATARVVALKGGNVGTVDLGVDSVDCAGNLKKTAIVASGQNFPDALAAGPLAFGGLKRAGGVCGAGSLPLLLTLSTSLPSITASTITDMGIQQVILLGGTSAVNSSVETALDNIAGVNVVRIAGADRQATAVQITKILGSDDLGDYDGGTALVARGDNFPDALAAAPYAGVNKFPLFLSSTTTSLGSTSAQGIVFYLNSAFFTNGTLLGGPDALSSQVQTDVGNAVAAQLVD